MWVSVGLVDCVFVIGVGTGAIVSCPRAPVLAARSTLLRSFSARVTRSLVSSTGTSVVHFVLYLVPVLAE